MNTTTIARSLRTTVAGSLLLLGVACSDPLGPNVNSNGQGGQNEPAAVQPGSNEKEIPAANQQGPTEGHNDNGAGDDQGREDQHSKGKVAA